MCWSPEEYAEEKSFPMPEGATPKFRVNDTIIVSENGDDSPVGRGKIVDEGEWDEWTGEFNYEYIPDVQPDLSWDADETWYVWEHAMKRTFVVGDRVRALPNTDRVPMGKYIVETVSDDGNMLVIKLLEDVSTDPLGIGIVYTVRAGLVFGASPEYLERIEEEEKTMETREFNVGDEVRVLRVNNLPHLSGTGKIAALNFVTSGIHLVKPFLFPDGTTNELGLGVRSEDMELIESGALEALVPAFAVGDEVEVQSYFTNEWHRGTIKAVEGFDGTEFDYFVATETIGAGTAGESHIRKLTTPEPMSFQVGDRVEVLAGEGNWAAHTGFARIKELNYPNEKNIPAVVVHEYEEGVSSPSMTQRVPVEFIRLAPLAEKKYTFKQGDKVSGLCDIDNDDDDTHSVDEATLDYIDGNGLWVAEDSFGTMHRLVPSSLTLISEAQVKEDNEEDYEEEVQDAVELGLPVGTRVRVVDNPRWWVNPGIAYITRGLHKHESYGYDVYTLGTYEEADGTLDTGWNQVVHKDDVTVLDEVVETTPERPFQAGDRVRIEGGTYGAHEGVATLVSQEMFGGDAWEVTDYEDGYRNQWVSENDMTLIRPANTEKAESVSVWIQKQDDDGNWYNHEQFSSLSKAEASLYARIQNDTGETRHYRLMDGDQVVVRLTRW